MANSVRRIADDNQKSNTWAVKSVAGNHQSKEDKRIMIRLDSKHEAHNAELFILRKQVQQPVSDPSLFVDAWQVPSGIGVLESSSAKAASILQRKEAIATIFGNVIVE
ncbi:BgTH12-02913 [Blumeria graminis f. sp. triticale]|uniref:BgTH12-02913 n=1 Tax=Blumeria graminis f. sp. triticale TaxID=1689686 RepID=A0A9W4DNF2_BLUGR|nr:BgTH12-02913 [Blumeria graminis f. sp. triticale]